MPEPERVLRNKKGFGLVEVMVAMVVLLLVFLAMIQTSLVGMDANVRNLLRGEATSVAEEGMSAARNVAYAGLAATSGSACRNVRGVQSTTCISGYQCSASLNRPGACFDAVTAVTELDGDGNPATDDASMKQVNVTVSWNWRGDNYTHRISTIRKR